MRFDEASRSRPMKGFLPRKLALLLAVLALGCASQLRRSTVAVICHSPTTGIQKAKQSSETINRPTSKPYTGDVSIFEDPKRDENLQPNRVMDILGIKEGSSVADIGAGSGWFSVRAARRVGKSGTVYAVD